MEVMSSLIMYLLPGMLGRGFDLKNQTIGADLWRTEDIKDPIIIEKYMTTSDYKVVSMRAEALDFLGVDGKLALKLQTGNVDVEGTGSYLKSSNSMENTLDLLVKVHYETVIKCIPSDVKPLSNWQEMAKNSGSTHFIRCIAYGGELIIDLRITAKSTEDKEVIRAMVTGELSSDSGSFGGGLKGNLEKIREKIGDTANMDINYYATVPLGGLIAQDLDSVMQLVQEFPEHAKAVNDGYGVPLSMEVFSLKAFEKDWGTYYPTLALKDQMTVISEFLSDIQNADQRLHDWCETLPPNMPEEQNNKIGQFKSKLDSIKRVFSEVIGNLDLSAEADAGQFKPAFEAYQGDNEEILPNWYVKELSKLKKEILKDTPSLEGDFGGNHYTYWGSETCPSETVQVFSGVMSTTDQSSIGSSEFTCLAKDRQYPKDEEEGETEIEDFPHLQQVSFISRKKNADQKAKTVPCSNCRIPGKSTTTMLVAETECPSGWTKQYQGTLVSTEYQESRGGLVCIDTSKSFEDVPSDAEEMTIATEASPKCGNFPCSGGVSATTSLSCVVCSNTKKSDSQRV